ncbi:lytic transglycosylase [Ruegeria sp.]|uniref:transglycosylase SLT domain-containing protein n=1 Tax=Ruegeria sp. TaxID=1879320 RepID=UPI003B008B87
MGRVFWVLALLFAVTSCGPPGSRPPRDLDNACAILRHHPAYVKAFRTTERRWGVPVYVQMATIYQESKFIADARPPRRYVLGVIPRGRQSSAYGYAQALDGTWNEYRRKTGRRTARRDRIRDAADFMGWYMNNTRDRNGIPLTDARRQYLAYHEGQSGYARGSYTSKPWLLRVASDVGERSMMYQSQLGRCGATL